MSAQNGASGESVLARLAALSDELPEAIAELERQRESIDTDLKRLRGLQRTLDPNHPTQAPPKPRQRPPAPRTGPRVSAVTLKRIADACLRREAAGELFTAQDIAADVGITDATIYTALKQLREQEFVGKAGEGPRVGNAAKGRMRYRVIDAHALEGIDAA